MRTKNINNNYTASAFIYTRNKELETSIITLLENELGYKYMPAVMSSHPINKETTIVINNGKFDIFDGIDKPDCNEFIDCIEYTDNEENAFILFSELANMNDKTENKQWFRSIKTGREEEYHRCVGSHRYPWLEGVYWRRANYKELSEAFSNKNKTIFYELKIN